MLMNIIERKLFNPSIEELIKALQSKLEKSFKVVDVKFVDCPDLSKPPFHLISKGICGNPRIADIGGVPYLMPIPNHQKVYNLKEISSEMGYKQCDMLGAGAAPSNVVGNLAELVINLSIDKESCLVNNSKIVQINKENNSYELKNFSACCEAKHLVNVYASLGDPGKVIEIKVSKRISDNGFIQCLQKILFEEYISHSNSLAESCIALGGVFMLQTGCAKIHVMPNYASEELINKEMINNWLRFFEMPAPLICLGYLVSHDPGLELRTEHFHCFNMKGAGGHFHHDVTPDDASYVAYFNVPECLYRIDMPPVTSKKV